jgi:hypothetical protein
MNIIYLDFENSYITNKLKLIKDTCNNDIKISKKKLCAHI